VAIFIKIPVFTLIPLIAYLIYQNIDRKKIPIADGSKILARWLLPAILVPAVWPVYVLLSGDSGECVALIVFFGNR
jgi:hypothetical protein